LSKNQELLDEPKKMRENQVKMRENQERTNLIMVNMMSFIQNRFSSEDVNAFIQASRHVYYIFSVVTFFIPFVHLFCWCGVVLSWLRLVLVLGDFCFSTFCFMCYFVFNRFQKILVLLTKQIFLVQALMNMGSGRLVANFV
jgi:uncharacterized membrane protein (DUF106 family)